MSDWLQLSETAGNDVPPPPVPAFLVGVIFGLLVAAMVLVVVGR